LSSDPAGGEEEIRRLLAAYQQYQAQAEAIAQQMGLTQLTVQGLDRAMRAVEAMETAQEEQEMLVPIGSGSYVHARFASKDKVVLNVGAGVSVEKSAAEAKEALKARREDVAEGAKKLGEMLGKIDQEMARIQAALSKYEAGEGIVQ
jgi:prefoldin alpha subunit